MVKRFLCFTLFLLVVNGCGRESGRGRAAQCSPDCVEGVVELHFNYSVGKGCQCLEINGDVFSVAFSGELISRIETARGTREPVVKMNFGADFPLCLRQAIVALVFPAYNADILMYTNKGEDRIVSRVMFADSRNRAKARNLYEHIVRIRTTYDGLELEGGFLFALVDSCADVLAPLGKFRALTLAEYFAVLIEKNAEYDGSLDATWYFGEDEYFECVVEGAVDNENSVEYSLNSENKIPQLKLAR